MNAAAMGGSSSGGRSGGSGGLGGLGGSSSGGGFNVTPPGGYPSAGSSGGGDVSESSGIPFMVGADSGAIDEESQVTAGDIQNALNDLGIYSYGEINPDDWEAEKVGDKTVLKAADGSDLTKEKYTHRNEFLRYKNLIDRYNAGEGYAVKNTIRDFDTESLVKAGYTLPKKKKGTPAWQRQGFSSPGAYYRHHEALDDD